MGDAHIPQRNDHSSGSMIGYVPRMNNIVWFYLWTYPAKGIILEQKNAAFIELPRFYHSGYELFGAPEKNHKKIRL